ncbi:tetratricopeptide repeat protein [Tautonia plasticadhaerens]|uniref:Photosystem I assembly protein Ycf3 n=1 Tax=Tautonia plasticadhaerens TaxID=2527974 RepID=A0A518H6R7_9BACT|nr:tetratricopeptide repeat protein [Tautonia plasticadhaerens]QDV36569.1 photosystem I assembly protein Ycf3 [Tautonia plasticadhaerens]
MDRADPPSSPDAGRHRIEGARGPGPIGRAPRPGRRSTLLAVALLPLAGAFGCRSMPRVGPEAPEPIMPSVQETSASSPMPFGSPPVSSTQPTDPEPLPELTADRSVNLYLDLGRVFESKGQLEAAQAEYARAVEAIDRKVDRPTRALAHRRLASVLDRQGKFGDSEAHYQAAVELAPRDARIWNNYGYSAYLRGDWEQAIARLRKAEKLDPGDPRTLTNLGLALAASGAQDEALDAFTRANGPAAAQANLAYILAATGRDEQARDRYEQALLLNPKDQRSRAAIDRLDAGPDGAEALAAGPSPVDPAVVPASFEATPP